MSTVTMVHAEQLLWVNRKSGTIPTLKEAWKSQFWENDEEDNPAAKSFPYLLYIDSPFFVLL